MVKCKAECRQRDSCGNGGPGEIPQGESPRKLTAIAAESERTAWSGASILRIFELDKNETGLTL
ncbi:hypothetical protein FGB90_12460 [Alteribacter natronophilus]|nr:hypothetical protein FGB90_12460 [Alteribacter natronophilus]